MKVLWLFALGLTACGGGGGSSVSPPATLPAALAANALEFAPGVTSAALELALTGNLDAAVLAEASIELPADDALTFVDAPIAVQSLVTLDSHRDGRTLRIVLGDARNPAPAALRSGVLVRIPLALQTPRQVGQRQVTLRGLRLARADGSAVLVESAPLLANVTVR